MTPSLRQLFIEARRTRLQARKKADLAFTQGRPKAEIAQLTSLYLEAGRSYTLAKAAYLEEKESLMNTQPPAPISPLLTLQCREHETGPSPRMRVWRSDWTGDQFEILTAEEFTSLTTQLKRFNIEIELLDDCDD